MKQCITASLVVSTPCSFFCIKLCVHIFLVPNREVPCIVCNSGLARANRLANLTSRNTSAYLTALHVLSIMRWQIYCLSITIDFFNVNLPRRADICPSLAGSSLSNKTQTASLLIRIYTQLLRVVTLGQCALGFPHVNYC